MRPGISMFPPGLSRDGSRDGSRPGHLSPLLITLKEYKVDIKELGKKKEALEAEILNAILPMVEKFKKETGLSPDRIHVGMDYTQSIGDEKREYFITDCKVSIDLTISSKEAKIQ